MIEYLLLDNLEGTFSPREHVRDEHVRRLVECLDDLPPVVVHAQTKRVIDGAHRVEAHRRAGRDRIKAELFHGTVDEAVIEAIRANTRHGLPLTVRERRNGAREVLLAHPDWSDRTIGRLCGLSPKTVGAVRAANAEIPYMPVRLGRDGRRRPLPPLPLPERLAESEVVDIVVDQAITSGSGGEQLAAWLQSTDPSAAHDLGALVPRGRIYAVAAEARRRARVWTEFAERLEQRAVPSSSTTDAPPATPVRRHRPHLPSTDGS